MVPEKFDMFRNRLTKVYRHINKQARRQGITCYRVYDHDLPEFPFCIEIYEQHIYLAEYKRRHSLTEEEHEQWLEDCIVIISEILELLNKTLQALSPGGMIYFSTNSRRFILDKEQIQAAVIRDITKATTPFDFQGKLFRWCYTMTK